MRNFQLQEACIKEVASAFGKLNEKAVFVGGSVVGYYINDPAADDIRPTKDIDVSIEVVSMIQLEEYRKFLNQRGFKHDSEIICRFHYKDIIVDIMGRKDIGWAQANKWFDKGFDHKIQLNLDNVNIWILSFPYFLASKFETYKSRGIIDPRFSKDFEDISYLLDNVSDFPEKILNSPFDVKKYLFDSLKEIYLNEDLQEGIISQLSFETQSERFKTIMEKIIAIINSATFV